MALIQLYQLSLSRRLSFRVMSLSGVVGISDLGEGSIRKLSVIVLTLDLFAECLECVPNHEHILNSTLGFMHFFIFRNCKVVVVWHNSPRVLKNFSLYSESL